VIVGRGSSPAPTLRPGIPSEAATIQAVWEASHAEDDPAGRPRGGWSVDAWATSSCALLLGDEIVGVAAVRAEPRAEIVESRIALEPAHRQPDLAKLLVDAAIDLARAAKARVLRIAVPDRADWAEPAVRGADFEPVRSVNHMLLAADVPLPELRVPAGVRIRAMQLEEEPHILKALNRNWADTWGFTPIRADMLAHDLEAQREGMLLGVDANDDRRILGTCHAVYDRADQNPDGHPRAWISNLTVDPDARGGGLGRAMLAAGLAFLRARGAASITLGVDADDPAPLRLYQSVGFQPISSIRIWDLGKGLYG
jgi:mycothiol synthase